MWEFIKSIIESPNNSFAIVGPNAKDIEKDIFPEIIKLIGEKCFSYNKPARTCQIYGKDLHLIISDIDYHSNRYTGTTFQSVYLHHETYFTKSFLIEFLLLRTRINGLIFSKDCPEGGPIHKIKQALL